MFYKINCFFVSLNGSTLIAYLNAIKLTFMLLLLRKYELKVFAMVVTYKYTVSLNEQSTTSDEPY